jgi:tetratricopeptide (TPR) repeat protein
LFAIALPWVFQTVERSYDWRSEVALIDKDVQAYPGQFMPIFLRITIQMSERSYQEAAAIAGRISDPEVRNVTLRMIEATYAVRINAIRTRRPEEAIDALQKLGSALKKVPAQYSWNPSVAYVWQYTQDIFSKQWGHLIDQFPDDALVRYKAGLWKLDAKDYDAAATHLRAAIESQSLPESLRGEAYRNLGVALLDGGHAAEAELPLRFAVQQFPPDFQADCILADVYKLIGRVKDAEQAEGECRSHVSRETSAH